MWRLRTSLAGRGRRRSRSSGGVAVLLCCTAMMQTWPSSRDRRQDWPGKISGEDGRRSSRVTRSALDRRPAPARCRTGGVSQSGGSLVGLCSFRGHPGPGGHRQTGASPMWRSPGRSLGAYPTGIASVEFEINCAAGRTAALATSEGAGGAEGLHGGSRVEPG